MQKTQKRHQTTPPRPKDNFGNVLYRQIAGALARRIVNYANVDNVVTQGEDAGAISLVATAGGILLDQDSKCCAFAAMSS